MPTANPDRRVTRTERSLHVALNSLILEKGYDATTVNDITGRANVGRSTLYAHHGGKEGLLLHGLQHLRTALYAASEDATLRDLAFSQVFFAHVHEHRDLYHALVRSESERVVTTKMKRIVAEAVSRDVMLRGRDAGVPRDALVEFTVAALFSILTWWFDRNPSLSPAQIDAIFRRLVLPALAPTGTK